VTVPEQRKEVDVTISGAPVERLTREMTTVQRDELNDRCITEIAVPALARRRRLEVRRPRG